MPHEALITRNEAILLSIIAAFAILWMIVIVPYFSASQWFQTQIPPIQFLIFEFGLILMMVVFFGVPIQYLYYSVKKNGNRNNLLFGATKLGLSFWAANKLIFDTVEPPFFLSTSGQVLLNNPSALTGTAVDAMLAWVGQQIGLSGFLLYLFVYVFFPILCVAIIVLVFTWKKVVKLFSGA